MVRIFKISVSVQCWYSYSMHVITLMYHGISNQQQLNYLFSSLSRLITKERTKLLITGLFVSGIHWWWIDSQRASDMENIFYVMTSYGNHAGTKDMWLTIGIVHSTAVSPYQATYFLHYVHNMELTDQCKLLTLKFNWHSTSATQCHSMV